MIETGTPKTLKEVGNYRLVFFDVTTPAPIPSLRYHVLEVNSGYTDGRPMYTVAAFHDYNDALVWFNRLEESESR